MKLKLKRPFRRGCNKFKNSYSQAVRSGRVFVLRVMPRKTGLTAY